MCGFCGAVFNRPVNIEAMNHFLRHRGPDHQAVYKDGDVSLGHARLSILDLSAKANQPMLSKSGRCVIAYNGEIYNFPSLKKELSNIGVVFKTHSDTEVLLEGYEHWGESIFERLNGMFAFAILDKKASKLILVRDRYGIKPLYYSVNGENLLFGSEMKSLLASGEIDTSLNYQGLYEYLHYSTTLGEETFYKGIKKLPPGHQLVFDISLRKTEIRPYKLNYKVSAVVETQDEAVEKIRYLFEESIKSQLVADVPVGVFLSGGIDSTAITALASKYYSGKLKTFSAGFDFDKGINELPNARYTAEYYETDHHEFHIKGNDIPDVLESLSYYFDQPFGDAANIPLFLMSKEVAGSQKVILQGDGGDELFAGYHRYNRLRHYRLFKMAAKILTPFRTLLPKNSPRYRSFRSLYALYQPDIAKEMAYIMSQEMADEDPLELIAEGHRKGFKNINPFKRYEYFYDEFKGLDPVQRMLYTDMNIILPDLYFEKVDRATMANSLEVRVPFLDNDLASYAMGLPSKYKINGTEKKYLLKKAFQGIVPDKILFGPKRGFSVPFQHWLKGSMKDFMYDTISANDELYSEQVNVLMEEHVSGKKDNGYMLWKLLNLSLWMKNSKPG